MRGLIRWGVRICVVVLVLALVPGTVAADEPDRADLDEQWEQRYDRVDQPRTNYSYRTRFGQRSHRTAVSPYHHIRDARGYFHVAPLLGAPGLFGDVTVADETTELDTGPLQSLQDINLTAGVAFEVGYRNVGVIGDFRHFNGTIVNGADRFDLETFVSNVAVNFNYEVLPVLQLGPVAGVRHFYARAGATDGDDNAESVVRNQWLDPIVGVNGRFNFADLVYLPFHADVGGIGYGSEITWQGYAGVGVSLKRMDIELGYRALYADYRGDELDYDLLEAGPTLMTRFRF